MGTTPNYGFKIDDVLGEDRIKPIVQSMDEQFGKEQTSNIMKIDAELKSQSTRINNTVTMIDDAVSMIEETESHIPPVVDNLVSTDSQSALSANQGRVLDSKIALKIDKTAITLTGFNLPTTAWVSSSAYTNYAYQASLTISGITSSDRVDVAFDPASVIEAMRVEVLSSNVTAANAVILYSKNIPTIALAGSYTVFKGA